MEKRRNKETKKLTKNRKMKKLIHGEIFKWGKMEKLWNGDTEKRKSLHPLMSALIRLLSRKQLITARAGNLRPIGAERHLLTNPYCRQSITDELALNTHTHTHISMTTFKP